MIRFAPAIAPSSSSKLPDLKQSIKEPTPISSPQTANVEVPAFVGGKISDETVGVAENGLLLSELPEISAPIAPKAAKARSPRKPKSKTQNASAEQLALNT
ncbi:MAG: hypothetical protein KGI75_22545 [Rhizobiaceae bacterium]|nr:hypothetical protein [Rhizobiaceae bacterium]